VPTFESVKFLCLQGVSQEHSSSRSYLKPYSWQKGVVCGSFATVTLFREVELDLILYDRGNRTESS